MYAVLGSGQVGMRLQPVKSAQLSSMDLIVAEKLTGTTRRVSVGFAEIKIKEPAKKGKQGLKCFASSFHSHQKYLSNYELHVSIVKPTFRSKGRSSASRPSEQLTGRMNYLQAARLPVPVKTLRCTLELLLMSLIIRSG